jgi:hypothetical protein
MKAGAYVLHLSCDHKGCSEHGEYVGNRTETEAMREARRDGWHIGKPWTSPDYCKRHKRPGHPISCSCAECVAEADRILRGE